MPYWQIIELGEDARCTPLAQAATLDAYLHWVLGGYIGDFLRGALGFKPENELHYDRTTASLSVGGWRDGYSIALRNLAERLTAEVRVLETDSIADASTDPPPDADMTVVGEAYTIGPYSTAEMYTNCLTYGMALHALRDYANNSACVLLHGRRFGKMREAHLYAVGFMAQRERNNYGIIAEAVIYDRVVEGAERAALLTGRAYRALQSKATNFIGGLPQD